MTSTYVSIRRGGLAPKAGVEPRRPGTLSANSRNRSLASSAEEANQQIIDHFRLVEERMMACFLDFMVLSLRKQLTQGAAEPNWSRPILYSPDDAHWNRDMRQPGSQAKYLRLIRVVLKADPIRTHGPSCLFHPGLRC